METLYKLTRPDLTTYNGYQWVVGEEHTFSGEGNLCGPGFCHAYLSPELALLLNPIHADYDPYVLWRGEGKIVKRDGQLKVGCTRFRIIEPYTLQPPTAEQRIAFAIFCAQAAEPCQPAWEAWAEAWLTGADRTAEAAWAARAEDASAWASAWASAAWAASANAVNAPWTAASWAAWAAKDAASRAANAANAHQPKLDLITLAKRAFAWVDPLATPEAR